MDEYGIRLKYVRLEPALALRVQVTAGTQKNNTGEVPEALAALAVPTAQLAKEWPSCRGSALAYSVAKRITRARFLFFNMLSCADSDVQVLVIAVTKNFSFESARKSVLRSNDLRASSFPRTCSGRLAMTSSVCCVRTGREIQTLKSSNNLGSYSALLI